MKGRRTYIAYRERGKVLDRKLTERLQLDLEEYRDSVIAKENTLQFSHGRSWRTAPTEFGDHDGELEVHSVELSIKFEDIRENRLEALSEFREALTSSLQHQFMTSLYGTITRSTDRTGNKVSAPEHPSLADAFLEGFRKIELAVDHEGKISLPEFHAAPEMVQKMMESLDAQGHEFGAELERLKEEKIAAAIDREQERLSKFPRSGSA